MRVERHEGSMKHAYMQRGPKLVCAGVQRYPGRSVILTRTIIHVNRDQFFYSIPPYIQ